MCSFRVIWNSSFPFSDHGKRPLEKTIRSRYHGRTRTTRCIQTIRDYRKMTQLLDLFNSNNMKWLFVKLLLQLRSIRLNAQDGRTTLSRAVEVGNEPLVQLFLHYPGTRINLADNNGAPRLHLAEKRLKMLIREKADLNARDFPNATPLSLH